MRYVSVFSGIEAASVAWEPLGWEPVAFCEIDAFPSAVLAERYPDVPNLGDITKVDWGDFIEAHGIPDVVVGGSPCQSFSIAGGRESLGGESRLMFEYIRAVQELRPRWLLWENVPGVLNTRDNAFVQLLDSLQELGYGLAWRVLDAQFFGVAQRRRRVFLVGYLGDGGASAAVLFEPESVSGNTQTSREKRQELAERATRCAGTGGECLTPWDAQSKRVFTENGCSPTLNSGSHEGQHIQPCVITQDGENQGHAVGLYADETPKTADELSPTLRFGGQGGSNLCVAFAQNTRDEVRIQGDGTISGALSAQPGMKQTTYVVTSASANANGSDTTVDEGKAAGIRLPAIAFQTDHLSQNGTNVSYDVVKTLDTQCPPVVCMSSGQANAEITDNGCSPTLTTIHEAPIVLDRAAFNQGANAQFGFHAEQQEVMETLVSRGPNAVCVRRKPETSGNG